MENYGIPAEDLQIVLRRSDLPHGTGRLTTGEVDTGVIVTHIPTGLTSRCDLFRSRMMNQDAAVKELSRLLGERKP